MNDTFMTIRGIELKLKPVSDMLKGMVLSKAKADFEREHGTIEPPTYMTSVDEEFYHDAHSIVKEDVATDADRKAWKCYMQFKDDLEAHLVETALELYLCRGVNAEPDDDAWESQQWGIDIPTDPIKKKVHWMTTEVLVSEREKYQLAAAIKQLADPVEEVAAQVADAFQRPLEKGTRPATE